MFRWGQNVLHIYDRVRRPRANMVLRRSVWAGGVHDSLLPLDGDGETSRLKRFKEDLAVLWEPVWHHDHRKDVDLALSMLENHHRYAVTPPPSGNRVDPSVGRPCNAVQVK